MHSAAARGKSGLSPLTNRTTRTYNGGSQEEIRQKSESLAVNAVVEARLEQALDKLKRNGIRMTPQRYAILSYLQGTKSHPTADDIYRALENRFSSMSVATVYNNLKVFIDAGLVRELTYGDQCSHFDADMSTHYHARCERCGKIEDFSYPPLFHIETAAENETGFAVTSHRLEVYGTCRSCRAISQH
ncbi:MAG: transcriptional repressor [Paenibacillaceae bacterium]|nr:transcriptional repressor [Paenibacillaceae bacterium]